MMSRLLTLPAGHTAKWFVLLVVVLIYGGLASQAGKLEGAQKNESSSWLPSDAESVKALDAVKRFPGGELAPAVIVYERRGGLTAADKARIEGTVTKLNADRKPLVLEAQPPVYSPNGGPRSSCSRSSRGTALETRSRTRCSRSVTASASPKAASTSS
jgi:RND superfamily putative drug exporter